MRKKKYFEKPISRRKDEKPMKYLFTYIVRLQYNQPEWSFRDCLRQLYTIEKKRPCEIASEYHIHSNILRSWIMAEQLSKTEKSFASI